MEIKAISRLLRLFFDVGTVRAQVFTRIRFFITPYVIRGTNVIVEANCFKRANENAGSCFRIVICLYFATFAAFDNSRSCTVNSSYAVEDCYEDILRCDRAFCFTKIRLQRTASSSTIRCSRKEEKDEQAKSTSSSNEVIVSNLTANLLGRCATSASTR